MLRLVRFLQSNFQFCHKICCALRPLCFCNIRSNAGSAFAYLAGHHILTPLIHQILIEIYDPNRKSKALSENHILFHKDSPKFVIRNL